jgi:cbb3-type cytochrome oxidase subunit 3
MFMNKAINNTNLSNRLLDSEMAYYKDYGTVLFPSIVINNQTFRGQLEVEAVMNGICAGFADPPKMCKRILESSINDPTILFYPEDQEVYEVHHVFLVCVLIMVTVAIVLCLYRRHAKREMKEKINVQIEDAVN